jgi:uncharacterized membrane protein
MGVTLVGEISYLAIIANSETNHNNDSESGFNGMCFSEVRWALEALENITRSGCSVVAVKLGQASQVAPIDKLSVVLVAVFAVAVLGERPTAREGLGIACVGAGGLAAESEAMRFNRPLPVPRPVVSQKISVSTRY